MRKPGAAGPQWDENNPGIERHIQLISNCISPYPRKEIMKKMKERGRLRWEALLKQYPKGCAVPDHVLKKWVL